MKDTKHVDIVAKITAQAAERNEDSDEEDYQQEPLPTFKSSELCTKIIKIF